MTHDKADATTTACLACPLRELQVFKDRSRTEVEFIQTLKAGEKTYLAGERIFAEKDKSDRLYTILNGWLLRFRTLAGDRRQIVNFGLPGDFLGLQAAFDEPMSHGVQAVTDVTLCYFDRSKFWELFAGHPRLAFDVTWLAAEQERSFEDKLLTLGQRTALERVAYLLWDLFDRARDIGLVKNNSLVLPVRQQHLADTLGLSLVHTNKTLQKIREDGAIEIRDRFLHVNDEARLIRLGRVEQSLSRSRPLI